VTDTHRERRPLKNIKSICAPGRRLVCHQAGLVCLLARHNEGTPLCVRSRRNTQILQGNHMTSFFLRSSSTVTVESAVLISEAPPRRF
jgi:hypothetical protein